ncbi:substrate-binding domain-containing protein [Thalassotalea sp. G20_0]|uniref:substrate-binding domain-containing protein n=1 Tax=Thalassotalea sp. G20_0 TaxID=2821093 RepID=UPI001ADA6324|nr:substrate-binding domain-containing protein [Thalassotalea sp. G20_0]MBO9493899.1 substrate-binding domain-containing protein [Thalassotalea sp. G20_0]
MVSIKDVAREANVSTATVSRVVNRSPNTSDEVVQRVWQTIRKLGYRPVIGRQSATTIGAVVSDVSEPFFGQMLKGIDQVARNHNKQLLIHNGHYSEPTEHQAIERLIGHCESAIVHSKWLSDETLIDFASQIPGLVLINRYLEPIAERCIALDNVQGGYIATRHLLNKGHQQIGYLCSDQFIDDAQDRLKGHHKAMAEAGIPVDERYIAACPPTEDGGRLGVYDLLAKGLPLTAIITYNDIMAAGALFGLQENGLNCPQDISVVGYDDLVIARYLHPKLSTVRYPIAVMAEQAARLAISLSDKNRGKVTGQIMMPAFVERNSVQALNQCQQTG